MGWLITCSTARCSQESWAFNVVDLIQNHRDENGWFQCSTCRGKGYIQKSFKLQEQGERWEPFLKGVIPLGKRGDTYQPCVFLVGYSPTDKPQEVWFRYYKDTRPTGGQLKFGDGPGGSPVLSINSVLSLVETMANGGLANATTLRRLRDALTRLLGK